MEDMKISELIAELTKVMNEHGDLPVKLVGEVDDKGCWNVDRSYENEENWLGDISVDVEPCNMHYECIIHA